MKTRNIWIATVLCGILSAGTACEDNRDEFLSDYSTILSIKQSGEVPLTLYKTGEDAQYHIVINKGGSDYKATTSVEVEVLDDAALGIYNLENQTDYVALPSDCYTLEQTQFGFGSDEAYKHLNIKLKTDAIYLLNKTEGSYVLPIRLVQSPDSINSLKSHAFIKPTVVVPTIYFETTGYVANEVSETSADLITLRLPLTMPIDNLWDFNCTVEVDESLLTAYNNGSVLKHTLLPADAYTLGSPVAFASNNNTADLEVVVDRTKLAYGYYILPVALTGCTQPAIQIDETRNTCLLGIAYVPNLTATALTVSMLSSNAKEPSEGSYEGLLDNVNSTFFHSAWSVAVPDAHYLQVSLSEECTAFRFYYQTRLENGNAAPAEIIVSGSANGTDFTSIATINQGLPTEGGNAPYTSQVFFSEQPLKYLRFTVTRNKLGNKFFVWSKFLLWTN